MAYSKVVASLLVALISSLISCVQVNAAVINLHNQCIRDRQDVLRLSSMNSGHHKVKKKSEPSPKAILDATRKDKRMVGQFYQWHNDRRRMHGERILELGTRENQKNSEYNRIRVDG